MAYSRTDLATHALLKANLIGAEETPSAADLEYANEGIASDTAALAVEGIVIWNGDDLAVPLEQLEPLARYHATTFQADFGLMSALNAAQARELEKRVLRKLSATPQTGVVANSEYY